MDGVSRAFTEMDRSNFIPNDKQHLVGIDAPIPIGFGQTNSQPTTVKRMLIWLNAQPGDKVLDIGSGSGWTTALLSSIVGIKGMVFAVEIKPKLLKFGESNCQKLNIHNAKFMRAKGNSYGLAKQAPFDRILVSASARSLPNELLKQLKIGGKLVVPVMHDILEITKISSEKYATTVHTGYIFVPLV